MTSRFHQLHAVVHGTVQGVGFRHSTVQRATELGLTGWVRNKSDGTVEVLAEGPRIRLESLLGFLHTGPPSASVVMVDTSWRPASEGYDTFEVRANKHATTETGTL